MLGMQYHPSSHSSFSLEISGRSSSPRHMNTDWAFFTGPLMRVESEQNHRDWLFCCCCCYFLEERLVSITLRSPSIKQNRNYSLWSLNKKWYLFLPCLLKVPPLQGNSAYSLQDKVGSGRSLL